jgi:predicted dehydrogenase
MYSGVQWWMDKSRAGGGAVIDNGVYMIDTALWLLGDPEVIAVTAQIRQAVEEPPPPGMTQDVEDFGVLFITCEGGKFASIEVAWVSNMTQSNDLGMAVHGTKSGLRIGPDPLTKISARRPEPGNALFGADYSPVRALEETLITREMYDYVQESWTHARAVTTAFVRALAEGRVPETPGREALKITRVIEAAYQSAKTGRSVALAELATAGAQGDQQRG